MDHDTAKFIFDAAQTALIAVIGVMNWLDKRQRVTAVTIERLEDNIDQRLDSQIVRLTRLEQDVKHAPTHQDMAEMYRELRKLSDSIAVMNGNLASARATLESVDELTKRMDTFWRNTNRI